MRINMLSTFLWPTRNINLLTLTSYWWLNMHCLMRMASFHPCRIISLVIDKFHLLCSFLRIIKILSCLIKHLNFSYILHSILHFLLMFRSKFKILIETSSCRTSSWICRCLSLSFNTFNYFSCFRIYSTERIHGTVFGISLVMTKICISGI